MLKTNISLNWFLAEKTWKSTLTKGIAMLLLGGLFLIDSESSLLFLFIVLGIYLCSTGAVILALYRQSQKSQKIVVTYGICSIIIGLLILIQPMMSQIFLVIAIALWALLTATEKFIAIYEAPQKYSPINKTAIISALLSFFLALFLLVFPRLGLAFLGFMLGIYLLFYGVLLVVTALFIKKSLHKDSS